MKQLKNQKGFTLIELLAVIVILAVLMMIAIPAMTQTIERARKDTYVSTAKSFVNQVRFEAEQDIYQLPNPGNYTAVALDRIELSSGSRKSTYGADFDPNLTYVVIVNDGTSSKNDYRYFVTMIDERSNGFSLKEDKALGPADILKGGVPKEKSIQTLEEELQAGLLEVGAEKALTRNAFSKEQVWLPITPAN